MGKHSKNNNDRAFFSNAERRAAAFGRHSSAMLSGHNTGGNFKEAGWGTDARQLDSDSMKEIDACSLSLQPCADPVVTPQGVLYDRMVVVQYILDRHGNSQLQPKPGTPEHGLYLQWCWFAESTFARPIGEIVNHRRVFEEQQQSDAAINEMKSRASLCVKALDEAIKGREFLVGNGFTAADIMMGYSMFIFDKYVSSDHHNNAHDYLNRLQQREACKVAFNL